MDVERVREIEEGRGQTVTFREAEALAVAFKTTMRDVLNVEGMSVDFLVSEGWTHEEAMTALHPNWRRAYASGR